MARKGFQAVQQRPAQPILFSQHPRLKLRRIPHIEPREEFPAVELDRTPAHSTPHRPPRAAWPVTGGAQEFDGIHPARRVRSQAKRVMVNSEIVAELLLQLLDRLAQVAARIPLRHIGPEQRGQRGAQVRPARHAQVEKQRLCFGGKSRIHDAGQSDFGRAEELELKSGDILACAVHRRTRSILGCSMKMHDLRTLCAHIACYAWARMSRCWYDDAEQHYIRKI